MGDKAEFDLTASPGQLLHRAQQFAAERFSAATGGVEVTQRQFAVLSALSETDGQTQTQLVQRTGIDRSTLAELVSRMGVLPLLFKDGQSWTSLGLKGDEIVTLDGVSAITPRADVKAVITSSDGTSKTITLRAAIDTENELDYFKNGGILHYVLRQRAAA